MTEKVEHARILASPCDATLESRIRGLQVQRAVLVAAASSPSDATVRRVEAVARLDAAERRHLLDRFWDRVTEGSRLDPAVVGRLRAMGTPELPADPTPEQLDAWIELAELASDEDFQRTTHRNATWLQEAAPDGFDPTAMMTGMAEANRLAAEAVEQGIKPGDKRAKQAVEALVAGFAQALGREPTPEFAAWLREQTAAHTDPRAARYWELVSIVMATPPPPEQVRQVTTGRWLYEALGAAG